MILSALAVTFAALVAFCTWLVVRFVNRRERWAKRMLVGIVIITPVLYVLGSGPATFLITHWLISAKAQQELAAFYSPLNWIAENGPAPVRDSLFWYTNLWRSDDPLIDDPADLEY
jgi:hypothetical protein